MAAEDRAQCRFPQAERSEARSNVISFDAAVSDRAPARPASCRCRPIGRRAEDMSSGPGSRRWSRALAELAPIFREAIVLREIEAMSYREIAELTGVPIGTVMSRLARARAELRKTLTRMMMEDDECDAM